MTRDALQLLSSYLMYAGQEIAAAQFASSDEIEPLVRAGWLVPTGLPSAVSCEACDEPHAAELVDRGPHPLALCRRTGETFDVPQQAALYRVEVAAVADSLACAMQLDGSPRIVKGTLNLWRLGARTLLETRVVLYFTPHLAELDRATTIIEAVVAQSGASRSGLIVASEGIDRIRLVTQRLAVIRLRDVATLSADGTFEIDEAGLAAAVLPELVQRRSSGAPAIQREKILPILDAMLAEGSTIDTSRTTCREVQARFKQNYPEEHVPVKTTIVTAIAAWLK